MTFSTRNAGFKVSFPNGYTISIGTSSDHYCDNHSLMHTASSRNGQWESKDCEIAIVRYADSDSREYVLTNQVEGYVTPLQFARVIEYVSSIPEDYTSKDIARTLEDILWKTEYAPRPDSKDDPVFPNSYPCDEDWDAPTNP